MAMPKSDSQPFRFLDLPPEIRLMAYEKLERKVKHTTIVICGPRVVRSSSAHLQEPRRETKEPEDTVTLVSRSTSTAILRTCRFIYEEAKPIIKKKIREWVVESGVSLLVSLKETGLCVLDVIIESINEELRDIRYEPQGSLTDLRYVVPTRDIWPTNRATQRDIFQKRLMDSPILSLRTTLMRRALSTPRHRDFDDAINSFATHLNAIEDFVRRSVTILHCLNFRNTGNPVNHSGVPHVGFVVRSTFDRMDFVTFRDGMGFKAMIEYFEHSYKHLPMLPKIIGWIDAEKDMTETVPLMVVREDVDEEEEDPNEPKPDKLEESMSLKQWNDTWIDGNTYKERG